jgi:hypothetical protein
MQITLTDDEAHTMRALLDDYLPALRREVSRTEAREFRHDLVKRQELCERLLELLEQAKV